MSDTATAKVKHLENRIASQRKEISHLVAIRHENNVRTRAWFEGRESILREQITSERHFKNKAETSLLSCKTTNTDLLKEVVLLLEKLQAAEDALQVVERLVNLFVFQTEGEVSAEPTLFDVRKVAREVLKLLRMGEPEPQPSPLPPSQTE